MDSLLQTEKGIAVNSTQLREQALSLCVARFMAVPKLAALGVMYVQGQLVEHIIRENAPNRYDLIDQMRIRARELQSEVSYRQTLCDIER